MPVVEKRSPVRLTTRGIDPLPAVSGRCGRFSLNGGRLSDPARNTLGLSVVGVLGVLIVFNVVYAAVSGPAGALSDQVGRWRLLVAGWLFYGAVYLGWRQAPPGRSGCSTGCTAYYGATYGVSKAWWRTWCHAQRYRLWPVRRHSGPDGAPASLIAGVLWQGMGGWDGLGPSAPFIFGAGTALLAVALLPLVQRRPGADTSG